MIRTDTAKWNLTEAEKYAVKWLNENGFDGHIEHQYVSKTIFTVSRDGITDRFELSQGIIFKDIKGYMEQYRKNWENLIELHRLRSAVAHPLR